MFTTYTIIQASEDLGKFKISDKGTKAGEFEGMVQKLKGEASRDPRALEFLKKVAAQGVNTSSTHPEYLAKVNELHHLMEYLSGLEVSSKIFIEDGLPTVPRDFVRKVAHLRDKLREEENDEKRAEIMDSLRALKAQFLEENADFEDKKKIDRYLSISGLKDL